ncbi:MAG TPA: hypothetical protein VLE51_02235 [Candidatus Saccharimonadales bacterium]|nr:hypothetical protein [Candidatus Saccharimonadales bacterium]
MNKNQKGFSAVEGLLILVMVGIVGFVGWYVWQAKDKSEKNLSAASSSSDVKTVKKETPKQSTTKSTAYNLQQLGISMDILDGWTVDSKTTQNEGVNFYTWTVSKPNADGKIVLSSTGFRGGFEECMLISASIKDVSTTKNTKLMFMSYSYPSDNKTTFSTGIVGSDETIFKTTDSETATSIKNKEVKPGSYFYCLGYPGPGFSLGLNNEPAPGFSRTDNIFAVSSSGNDYLSSTAQSYPDIKAMLTSIK